MGLLDNTGFSPGRTTRVTFDVHDYALVQDPWWLTRHGEGIAGGAKRPLTDKVHYVRGIGWQLETLHDNAYLLHDENAGYSEHMDLATGGLLAVASSPTKSLPTLPGVPTGSQVAGDDFNQMQVGAGDTWGGASYRLGSDQSSYPDPTSSDDVIPMDRVYVGDEPMTPDQVLSMRFYMPGTGGGDSIGSIATVYFSGLDSSAQGGAAGTGEYALKLRADGKAFLFEKKRSDGSWTIRLVFRWSPAHFNTKAWHYLVIRSDAWYSNDVGAWLGHIINFECQVEQAYAPGALGVGPGVTASAGFHTTQYLVPTTQDFNPTPVPVRLDIRRDVRMKVSLSFTEFEETGTLQTQTFHCPFQMGAMDGVDPTIEIRITGQLPQTTSVGIALYGKDGTACGVSGDSGTSDSQVWKSFTRLAGQQEYYAVLTFHRSTDKKHSPAIDAFYLVRDGTVSETGPTPFVAPPMSVTDWSVVGPSMDPRTESASIGLLSLQDGFTVGAEGVADPLAPLNTRSGLGCRIDLLNLPDTVVNGNTVNESVLFLGKLQTMRRKRLGVRRWSPLMKEGASAISAYPSMTWWQGKAVIVGLWKRLMQAKTNKTFNFADKDPSTNELYTITKICQILLSNAGLPSKMMEIEDLPIKLMCDVADKSIAGQVEIFSEAMAWVMQLMRDYLGAALIIDPNATNGGGAGDVMGCVRMKLPPRPDGSGNYKPLAAFVDDANWTSGLYAKMSLPSYPATVRADGASIPTCPVLGRTVEYRDEPPEGNAVYVSGAAATVHQDGVLASASAPGQLWAVIYNWPAAKFLDGQPIAVDPTHPDYTDGTPNMIVNVDPGLNTQQAVNFAARRIFDLACHRREYVTFSAPIVLVVDADDAHQIRPRKLRWGDPVLYQGKTWWVGGEVTEANGERGGTRNSLAVYELFRIPLLQEVQDGVTTVYQAYQVYAPIAAGVA